MEVLLIAAVLYAMAQQTWKRTDPAGSYSATSAATRAGARAGARTGTRSARETWDRRRPDRVVQRGRRRERWARSGIFGWLAVQAERGTISAGRLVVDGTACAYRGARDGSSEAREAWRTTWRDHHPEDSEPVRSGNGPVPDPEGRDGGTGAQDSPRTAPGQPEGHGPVFDKDGDPDLDVRCTNCGQLPDQTTPIAMVDGRPICLDCRGGLSPRDQWLQAHYPNGTVRPQPLDAFGRSTLAWPGKPPAPVPPPTDPPAETDREAVDGEEDIRSRRSPWWNRAHPEPLTEAQRRFWTARGGGYTGPIDQDGRRVEDGSFPFPPPIDPPAGTDPDGTSTPAPITTGGTPMGLRDAITESANREPARGAATATLTRPGGGGEVDDLATLQRIAARVVQQHEESEFMKLIRLCQTLPESADFGDRVGKVLGEFGELCVALGKVGAEVAEMAPGVSQIAGHVRGES